MNLTDRIVVVTGGAGGIGAALSRRFAAEGAAAVVVADL
ncbi:SDR family NAD(P)-dependent oxidoreductase, partial [Micromonospora sp. PSH25]|nr:SDR family NAD(P)-dependent oxidoreductase [Micromonospora foliorum]